MLYGDSEEDEVRGIAGDAMRQILEKINRLELTYEDIERIVDDAVRFAWRDGYEAGERLKVRDASVADVVDSLGHVRDVLAWVDTLGLGGSVSDALDETESVVAWFGAGDDTDDGRDDDEDESRGDEDERGSAAGTCDGDGGGIIADDDGTDAEDAASATRKHGGERRADTTDTRNERPGSATAEPVKTDVDKGVASNATVGTVAACPGRAGRADGRVRRETRTPYAACGRRDEQTGGTREAAR